MGRIFKGNAERDVLIGTTVDNGALYRYDNVEDEDETEIAGETAENEMLSCVQSLSGQARSFISTQQIEERATYSVKSCN